ncbi:MAG: LysE family translocator [Hyphomicrobiales bacterium]
MTNWRVIGDLGHRSLDLMKRRISAHVRWRNWSSDLGEGMDPHLWLGFVAASLVMGLVPGPAVMNIVGFAISSGRRTALASVAGLAIGNLTAMTISLAGVGALLAASAFAFSILKWAGALYLIFLGMMTLAKTGGGSSQANSISRGAVSPRMAFASNVAVGTFHPKTIVFFVAFAPQFITPSGNYLLQAVILIVTFTMVVGFTDALYALVVSRAADVLRTPAVDRWSKRVGGGVLIAAGVATAASRNGS